jgi:hypothetical protein
VLFNATVVGVAIAVLHPVELSKPLKLLLIAFPDITPTPAIVPLTDMSYNYCL